MMPQDGERFSCALCGAGEDARPTQAAYRQGTRRGRSSRTSRIVPFCNCSLWSLKMVRTTAATVPALEAIPSVSGS